VIVLDTVEIDQPDLVALDLAITSGELNVHALSEQSVDPAVFLDERRCLADKKLLDGFGPRLRGNIGVQPLDDGLKTAAQNHVGIGFPLWSGAIRGDLRGGKILVAEALEDADSGVFNHALVEGGARVVSL